MDTFIEQLVIKGSTPKDTLAKAGLVVAALVLVILFMFLPILLGLPSLSGIGLLLAAGSCYGAYYLISGMSVEYEYIVTNGEIDVDKIIAKRRRKRMVTVKASNFQAFGLLKEAEGAPQGTTTMMACANDPEHDYYADFDHSKFGRVRLIFSPDERTLEAMKPFLPRLLKAHSRIQ